MSESKKLTNQSKAGADQCASRAAYISHDLIQNNQLAFSSNELAFLTQLTFRNQSTEFRIDLEACVNCQNLQLYKFSDKGFSATEKYGSKITNHSQLTWPFELHVKHTGQPRFWLVRFFLSDALSSLVWSYLLDSTLLSRNMSLNISFFNIYSLHINKPKYKKNDFSIWKRLNWRFAMDEKASSLFRIELWLIHAVVWQLSFAVSSHFWLVAKQLTFQKFSLVFTVLRERL